MYFNENYRLNQVRAFFTWVFIGQAIQNQKKRVAIIGIMEVVHVEMNSLSQKLCASTKTRMKAPLNEPSRSFST